MLVVHMKDSVQVVFMQLSNILPVLNSASFKLLTVSLLDTRVTVMHFPVLE